VVYTTGAFSSGYTGTTTSDGSGGYLFEIRRNTDWDYDVPLSVHAVSYNDVDGILNDSFVIYTEEEPQVSGLSYNIYYRTKSRTRWVLANATPVAHSDLSNDYTIEGLDENVEYEIAVVAGTYEDGVFTPLIKQPIDQSNRGAGGLEIVKNHPYHSVKTFTKI
jgi:hypothetical protein